jgi:2-polyprenyl-3-methyl-5-hydroxy-6-metoxy-1,4-benzoquinol methylase
MDGTVDWLKEQADIKCIFNEQNNGFPKGCNQGMEVATGSEILFLNSDTVVTSNWLKNLKTALYSDEKIGAVGPVTNNCSNYQAVDIDYKDTNDLQIFAEKYNVSNAEKWEEKIKLVGFCILIKRSVIDEIGYLDELFTVDQVCASGISEDDDYCFRMITAGYRLLVCQDTFIHYFGSVFFQGSQNSYNELVDKNVIKFKEKWGFHPIYSGGCRLDVIHFMEDINKPDLKVLEVGCACGATLLKIKHLNKTAEVHGIEICSETAAIAKHFANITAENVENTHIAYEEEMFDYIIFGDVLEHLYQPQQVLQNMKKYLKPGGYILASLPNIMHVSIIKDLLKGNWTYQAAGILDKTHIRFFTLNEIFKMFTEVGLKDIKYVCLNIALSADDEELINKLESVNLVSDRNLLLAYQYLLKVRKQPIKEESQQIPAEVSLNHSADEKQKLKFILRRIENDIDEAESLSMIIDKIIDKTYNILEIVESIECDIYKRAKVTILISTALYKKNMVKETLKLLLEMYKIYSQDSEIVYTFAYILVLVDDRKMALKVLTNFKGENEEIKALIKEIGVGD